MCFLCSQNAWKASFCSVGNSNLRDHIVNRCGVTTVIVFIDFFSKNWIFFQVEFFVFFNRNVHISITLIPRIYQKRFPFFFATERRFNWSPPLNILEPTLRKITSVNRCRFSFIWLRIQSLWCFFSSEHPNSFPLQFSFFRLFVIFFHSVSLNWCFRILFRHFWETGAH